MHSRDSPWRATFAAVLFVVIFLSLRFEARPLDPSKTISQDGHDIWLRENGLPSNGVNVCLPSRDGYVWLGTSGGLFRFDGVSFLGVKTDDFLIC